MSRALAAVIIICSLCFSFLIGFIIEEYLKYKSRKDSKNRDIAIEQIKLEIEKINHNIKEEE